MNISSLMRAKFLLMDALAHRPMRELMHTLMLLQKRRAVTVAVRDWRTTSCDRSESRVSVLRATTIGALSLFVLTTLAVTPFVHAQPAVPATSSAKAAPTLPARLTPATRATIERLVDSLKLQGLPTGPLYDKAAEGVLKNADDTRILVAVRALARELGAASSLLGPAAQLSDVVSAASALSAGVPASAVQKLANRRAKNRDADGRLSMSYIILVDFASRGVPVDAAVNTLDGLLARGAGGAELSAFRAGVERDLMAGRDARTTLNTRAEGVLRRR